MHSSTGAAGKGDGTDRGARAALLLRRVLLLDDLDDLELGLCVGLCALLLLALDALDLVDRVEVRLGRAVRAAGLGKQNKRGGRSEDQPPEGRQREKRLARRTLSENVKYWP